MAAPRACCSAGTAALVASCFCAASLLAKRNQRAAAGNSLPRSSPGAAAILLLDNGSLAPSSTLALRDLATRVSAASGAHVAPVSARFSDRLPAAELNGLLAECLPRAITRLAGEGHSHFIILPAFLGPSDTLTKFVPSLFASHGDISFHVCRPLVDVRESGEDDRVARALVDGVRSSVARQSPGDSPAVIVCDHGSPLSAVNDVRNHVAAQVAMLLNGEAAGVSPASMERRLGAAYDFNEPTLAGLLAGTARGVAPFSVADRADGTDSLLPGGEGGHAPSPFSSGRVVVAMMFVSPGKHAGPGGDVATIVDEAVATAAARAGGHPPLAVSMSPLLGEHPLIVELLVDRLAEGVTACSS